MVKGHYISAAHVNLSQLYSTSRLIHLFYSSDIDVMFNTSVFDYVTSLMILSLNMATNDGEMLFHFADSNKYNYCIYI